MARSRKPQQHDEELWFLPREGEPLPRLADLLDRHEHRLRSYCTREESDQRCVPELARLILSSRKALRDGRPEEAAVHLLQIERIVGFQQGLDQNRDFLRLYVIPDQKERLA